MSVANIEIDITNYSGRKDFSVSTEFVDNHTYTIIVKRIDSKGEGWTEGLKVFVSYTTSGHTDTVVIGSSKEQEKRVNQTTTFDLERDDQPKAQLQAYSLQIYPEPQYIKRVLFNKLFNTDIVVLPKNIFAVGVRKGCVYIYSESNEYLYMIELSIKHIVTVGLTKNVLREFYFLICAFDGYMENHYLSKRNKPRQIAEFEMVNQHEVNLENADEYPKFHKDEYMLSQSNQIGMTNVISVPDRYFFYLNRYNEYRSIHNGIPFANKKSQIVFGSQPRGKKYNFIKRQDIDVTPREYFKRVAVGKDYIVAPEWINRKDMIDYKYILDIDGNASTWDATAWKLNSGSVIMKSDSAWSQWFYQDYKEWVHYVPIAEDFSDIKEKFDWCESNQYACQNMINRCKELFQKVYRLSNVIEYTSESIYRLSRLQPYILGNRRIFFVCSSNNEMPNLKINKQICNGNLSLALDVSRKLNPADIMVFMNTDLTDINNFDLASFMAQYDSFNAKIVFGSEKNLWPDELEPIRYKIESICNSSSDFKYLNAGFYVAEAGEMEKLLDERVFEINGINEQDYYTRAYVTKRYSMALDTEQKLVMNTYKCSGEEINAKKASGTPFIHYNAGR
jgi:hypothetical protein